MPTAALARQLQSLWLQPAGTLWSTVAPLIDTGVLSRQQQNPLPDVLRGSCNTCETPPPLPPRAPPSPPGVSPPPSPPPPAPLYGRVQLQLLAATVDTAALAETYE